MKIAVCSDLHLEFQKLVLKNEDNADVLILSGDICVEADLDMYDRRQTELGFARNKSSMLHEFFTNCASEFKTVIYIMGNHEHYHGDFAHTANEAKRKLAYIKNLHVLDKECVVVDDVTFIGGTLWTDMNKEDPLTLHGIKDMMNDFRCVKNSNRYTYRKVPLYKRKADDSGYEIGEDGMMIEVGMKMKEEPSRFSPIDAVDDHRKMLDYIKTIVAEKHDEKFVVVGHHTPSTFSCHPRYKDDFIMNGGYHSSLEEFILDRPQIKLWTHGHTHELFDYTIGETRVVCNPRGYAGYEDIAVDFKLKVVEL